MPKQCKLIKADAAVKVIGEGRLPFLGTAQVKFSGPITLTLVARSTVGGEGRLRWRTKSQESFPESGQTVSYKLSAGQDWQEITVVLPIRGEAGIVRLYLPAEKNPVELQSIQFTDENGRAKTWDFSGVTP